MIDSNILVAPKGGVFCLRLNGVSPYCTMKALELFKCLPRDGYWSRDYISYAPKYINSAEIVWPTLIKIEIVWFCLTI